MREHRRAVHEVEHVELEHVAPELHRELERAQRVLGVRARRRRGDRRRRTARPAGGARSLRLLDDHHRAVVGELAAGKGATVVEHRLCHFSSECLRRDRAVGSRSERALIESRRERGKELALADRPLTLSAHHPVQHVAILFQAD